MLPVSRSTAAAAGEKRYYTGKPCVNGHTAERNVRSKNCIACDASRTRARRSIKGDDVRHVQAVYRDSNRAKINRQGRESYHRNRDNRIANMTTWRRANPERVRDSKRADSAQRRAAILQRRPLWADRGLITAVYDDAIKITRETGEPMHVDHIIPLQGAMVSGLHVHTNLQVIPAKVNLSKSNKWDVSLEGNM